MRIISVLLVLIVSFLSPMVPHLIEPYQDGTDLDSIVQTQFVSGRSGQSMMSNTVYSDTFGGSGGSDFVADVTTDGSGNHVVTGAYSYTATIGSSSYGSPNGQSAFVGKISAFGTWLWVLNATNVEDYATGISMDIDSNGMIYVTGCGFGSYNFGAYTLGSTGEMSNFVIKINPQGNLVWAIDAIGDFDCDLGSAEIVVDGNGGVGLVGTIYGSVTPASWTSPVEFTGYQSAYFAKVNPGGSQWVLFEAIGGDYGSTGRSIDLWSGSSYTCSSSSNNFLIAGTYVNNLDYGSVNFTTARYDTTAYTLWLCGDDGSVHYGIGEGQYQGGTSSVIKSWFSSNDFSTWNRGSAWSYSTSSTNDDSCTGINNISNSYEYLYTYDCNYPNNLGFTSYATSPTFSGSGYSTSNTYTLAFSLLLGIESNSFDNAIIEVNYYGTWYSIWSNPSTDIIDSGWTTQSLDITNYFPGNPNFQVRFGIGSTDSSVTYTGWNIDDVKLIQGGGTSDDGSSMVSKVRFVSSSGYESCVAVVGEFDTTLNWHTSTNTIYDVATTSSGSTNQFSNIICANQDADLHSSEGIALVSEPSLGIIDAEVDTASEEVSLLGMFSGTQYFDGTWYSASGCTDLYIATQDANQGSFDSVTLVGGSSCDQATSFKGSNSGNFVLGGWLSGDYTYGTTTFSTPDEQPDGYVASVSSSGTFTWIQQVGGRGGYDASYDIAVLDNGDSVQIGFATGEFTVNRSLYSSSGLYDTVLIKRDASGAVTQLKKIGTSAYELGYFIEADSQSNLFIAGLMDCASPPTISHSAGNDLAASCPSSSSQYGMFVAKLDNNLDPAWVRGVSADWQASRLFMMGDAPVLSINANQDSDVVASSSMSYTTGEDGNEWVFTKYNPQTGNPEWMNSIKAVNKGTEIQYLSADNDETNLYLTGSFIGTLQFDSVSTIASSGDDGTYDTYIASLNDAGAWEWALAAGGTQDETSMSIQVTDRVYVAGTFTDSMVAGSTLLGSTGQGVRPYLLTVTTGGSWVDAQQLGTTEWEPMQIISLSNESLAFFGSSRTDVSLTGGITLSSQAFSSGPVLSTAFYDTQSTNFLRGAVLEDVLLSDAPWTISFDNNNNFLLSSNYQGVDVPNALQGGLDDGSTNGYVVSISVDWDGDEVMNEADACPIGAMNWVSDSSNDHDTDGCRDLDEDDDDDNDGRIDSDDSCFKGLTNWLSSDITLDYDSDGCHDATEDTDDDNDGITDPVDVAWGVILNGEDFCPTGELGWSSNNSTDHDGDGCADDTEDNDDDQDGLNDSLDDCPRGKTWWDALLDLDMDGCFSPDEDQDADNDGIIDDSDDCPTGQTGWNSSLNSDHDGDGCNDELEDADDDNDGVLDETDMCPSGEVGWTSSVMLDHDGDGCHDELEDADDDNDGVLDTNDLCPTGSVPIGDMFDDYDSDGCENNEDVDDDNDNVLDENDLCPSGALSWTSTDTLDHDRDGCKDEVEDADDDNDGVLDTSDLCPVGLIPVGDEFADFDLDGCENSEDADDDNDMISDEFDLCQRGIKGWQSTPTVDHDADGCLDDVEDTDDDNDSVLDEVDQCPNGVLDWTSSSTSDHDADGCRDVDEDSDDDNDAYVDDGDACPTGIIGPWDTAESDHDEDGCVDSEDNDMDGDGVLNEMDLCPLGAKGWLSDRVNDADGDGCKDSIEDDDDDGDGTLDANQFMLSGEGATYTWTRIGAILAVIILVGLLARKKKAQSLAPPAHFKVDAFFQGDSNDSPVNASDIRSSTYCSTCGGHGEWYVEHNWAWCHQCDAWVP